MATEAFNTLILNDRPEALNERVMFPVQSESGAEWLKMSFPKLAELVAAGGIFIPMTGTAFNTPVTGNISFGRGLGLQGQTGQGIFFTDRAGLEIAAQAGQVRLFSYAGEVRLETGYISDINLNTFQGKAYYNDVEIATVDDVAAVGGAYVPMTGTAFNTPVTGNISFGRGLGLQGQTGQGIYFTTSSGLELAASAGQVRLFSYSGEVALETGQLADVNIRTVNGRKAYYNDVEIATVDDVAAVGGAYVPLIGTTLTNPVTGMINVKRGVNAGLQSMDGVSTQRIGFDANGLNITTVNTDIVVDTGNSGSLIVNVGGKIRLLSEEQGDIDIQTTNGANINLATMDGVATYNGIEIATIDQLDGSLANYVPLTGTTYDKPMTGNLWFDKDRYISEVSSGSAITFLNNSINILPTEKLLYNDEEVATVNQLDNLFNQIDNSLANYVPLTGNTYDNPITGNLFFANNQMIFGGNYQTAIQFKGDNLNILSGKLTYNNNEILTSAGNQYSSPIMGYLCFGRPGGLYGDESQEVFMSSGSITARVADFANIIFEAGGNSRITLNTNSSAGGTISLTADKATYNGVEIATKDDIANSNGNFVQKETLTTDEVHIHQLGGGNIALRTSTGVIYLDSDKVSYNGREVLTYNGSSDENPIVGNFVFSEGQTISTEYYGQVGSLELKTSQGEIKISPVKDRNLILNLSGEGKALYKGYEILTDNPLTPKFIKLTGNTASVPITGPLFFNSNMAIYGDGNQSIRMRSNAVDISSAKGANISLYTTITGNIRLITQDGDVVLESQNNGNIHLRTDTIGGDGKAYYDGVEIATKDDIAALSARLDSIQELLDSLTNNN